MDARRLVLSRLEAHFRHVGRPDVHRVAVRRRGRCGQRRGCTAALLGEPRNDHSRAEHSAAAERVRGFVEVGVEYRAVRPAAAARTPAHHSVQRRAAGSIARRRAVASRRRVTHVGAGHFYRSECDAGRIQPSGGWGVQDRRVGGSSGAGDLDGVPEFTGALRDLLRPARHWGNCVKGPYQQSGWMGSAQPGLTLGWVTSDQDGRWL